MILTPTTIVVSPSHARHEVKRSIFDGFAEPMANPDEFEALLSQHFDPDARHHCWAWRCDGEYRFNDDGEPAGTAGRPILQALEGAGIERTLVIVRRYFGGIKLGAGGLVRAYSAAATQCLQQAATRQLIPHVQLTLEADFEHTQALFRILQPYQTSAPEHTSHGIRLHTLIPLDHHTNVLNELNNQTRGQIQISEGDTQLA